MIGVLFGSCAWWSVWHWCMRCENFRRSDFLRLLLFGHKKVDTNDWARCERGTNFVLEFWLMAKRSKNSAPTFYGCCCSQKLMFYGSLCQYLLGAGKLKEFSGFVDIGRPVFVWNQSALAYLIRAMFVLLACPNLDFFQSGGDTRKKEDLFVVQRK